MNHYQAKDLYQLQSELIELKVDMAVNRTIERVVDQITNLRHEVHKEIGGLRREMHTEIGSLRNDMHGLNTNIIAIETKLGMVGAKRKAWSDRFMDLFFKAGWVWLSPLCAYLIIHLK